ncbi:MAG: hypothetical protein PS018_27395 [bacterium]|nr:hypothetical protein [bacterium]
MRKVSEAPGRKTQAGERPEAEPQVVSNAVPVIAVSLAALVIIGAATANSLPNLGSISLRDFNQYLPTVDRSALPDFSRFSPPGYNRVAAVPPPPPAPVLVPDPVVRAGLRDIQSSEEQNADMLMSLTQSASAQAADLKRITRQLALLTAQVNSLQNPATPQPPPVMSSIPPSTTPSIPPSPPFFGAPSSTTSSAPPAATSSIPRPIPRARVAHTSRKLVSPVIPPAAPPTLPPVLKPEGPYSVGGAPLGPAPSPGSG